MTALDFVVLSPLILVALTSLLAMLITPFYRHHRLLVGLSCLGLLSAFGALFFIHNLESAPLPRQVTDLFIMDNYSNFFMGLILLCSLAVTLMSYGYWEKFNEKEEEKEKEHREEFYLALLFSTLGAMAMVSAQHFASFFLGLELLSVPLYTMISYSRTRPSSLEAGLKYLVLAGASSAFLLFGMSLIYAQWGTLHFTHLSQKLAETQTALGTTSLLGLGLMITGIGFKLSLVPFHMWTPDVYQGSSAPVGAFLATVSKGATLALLLRFFWHIEGHQYPLLLTIFSIMAGLSMFVGNLLALLQKNVKRLLAFSSIAHMGYILVAFVVGGAQGFEAILYYFVAYAVTIISAFTIITLQSSSPAKEWEVLSDYQGLCWTHPWMGGGMTAVLFSLAGIPLTAGFIGKYFIVAEGVSGGHWLLVFFLVINSSLGLYYYLKIVVVMLMPPQGAAKAKGDFGGQAILVALALTILFLGVYPSPLLSLIRRVTIPFF